MRRPPVADIPSGLQQAHPDARCVFHALGIASCAGASDRTCQTGPDILYGLLQRQPVAHAHGELRWATTLRDPTGPGLDALAVVTALAQRVAQQTRLWVAHGHAFVVVGGDHSCAVGTWSGAAHGMRARGPLGLIWIDAHMDGHTPETSPSGALHGMPLAILLGHGPHDLTQLAGALPTLQARHVWLIGVRSYEAQEQQRLTELGVNIVYMPEVKARGIVSVLMQARAELARATAAYGVTIDLDAVDPVDAPGVGCPEPGGIHADDLLAGLRGMGHDPCVVGLEIAELNPRYDPTQKTALLARDLLAAWMDQ
ncbi:MAG: arginase [Pseudomonadota bacterium]